jgi:hypothetical protein
VTIRVSCQRIIQQAVEKPVSRDFSPVKKVYQYIAEYYFYCNQPARYSIMFGIKWFIRNSAAVFSGYRINVLRLPMPFNETRFTTYSGKGFACFD